MNDTTLGKLIDNNNASKDAIHIAVAPVKAMHTLKPGQHIGFVDNTNQNVGSRTVLFPAIKPIGIVDPFLEHDVRENEWFYMLLYPKTITGLKHVWTHPDFTKEKEESVNLSKLISEQWLRTYIKSFKGDYDQVIEAIKEKGHACFGHDLDYEDFSNYKSDFWQHVENVLGTKLSDEHKKKVGFSCAC